MSTTITYTESYNAQWTLSVPYGETPQWLTTNTNYWIGDATLPNGVQPNYNLDFGFIIRPAGINIDLGNI